MTPTIITRITSAVNRVEEIVGDCAIALSFLAMFAMFAPTQYLLRTWLHGGSRRAQRTECLACPGVCAVSNRKELRVCDLTSQCSDHCWLMLKVVNSRGVERNEKDMSCKGRLKGSLRTAIIIIVNTRLNLKTLDLPTCPEPSARASPHRTLLPSPCLSM